MITAKTKKYAEVYARALATGFSSADAHEIAESYVTDGVTKVKVNA